MLGIGEKTLFRNTRLQKTYDYQGPHLCFAKRRSLWMDHAHLNLDPSGQVNMN